MMRFSFILALCLCLSSGFAYANQPTKTLAQGGWFAIGGPGNTADMLCSGMPCTDQAFANAYGAMLSAIMPGNTDLHDSKRKAEDALKNGQFSVGGPGCQPMDSGMSGALVSGFVRYYTLDDFTYEQLDQAAGLPSSDGRIMDFTNAISMVLNNLNLGGLAVNSNGPLINQDNGQMVDLANYQVAFTDLDLQGYQLIERWAKERGAVVNGLIVTDLQAVDFTCP